MDTLEKLTKQNEQYRKILNHLYSEKTGAYFICGDMGVKDTNGLPDKILVCPTHGADWFQVYEKTDKRA